jgi:hypothetical protein
MKTKLLATLLIPFLFFSCASKAATQSYLSFKADKESNLGEIYDQAAQYEGPGRNPVIVIPGFLGSRLINQETNKLVWGNFTLTPILSIAKQTTKFVTDSKLPININEALPLARPMKQGISLDQIKTNVVSDGVLKKVDISYVGLHLHFGAYSHIVDALGAGKYRLHPGDEKEVDYGEDHYTSFEFGYDWRQDLVETAKQLHEFILEKRAYIQKEYEKKYGIKNYDVKFDIVCHSMGGLLSRYYLRFGDADLPEDGSKAKITWKGAKYVDELIIVATPNAGYLDTFLELNKGLSLAPLPKFHYSPAIGGTWATYYQMLPAFDSVYDKENLDGPALDIFDPNLWIQMKWGLADPEYDAIFKRMLPDVESQEERREIAIDHLTKCLNRAKQFIKALEIKAKPPKGTTLHLFAGDAIKTNSKVGVNMKNGQIKVIETAPGDGVVLRSSALYDQRAKDNWSPGLKSPIYWTSVTFLFGAHMALTTDPVFKDNVLFLLLDEPAA